MFIADPEPITMRSYSFMLSASILFADKHMDLQLRIQTNGGSDSKVVVNKTRLNFIDVGDSRAKPIILIHAFPLSLEMWKSQIEVLKQSSRVVAYDIRGQGESEVGDGQYTMEFFVDDLIGLMDHLKIERAILCGLSMGGYVSLRTAERNPERLRALVLCDTKAEADSNEAKLKRAASIRSIKDRGLEQFADSQVMSALTEETFARNPARVQTAREMILRNSPIGLCGALLAMVSRTDTTTFLPSIRVPTLILVGDKDNVTPPDVSKRMHDSIPNSQMRMMPGAAHWSNIENSQEFNKHLGDFLAKFN